jgi:galactokinase
MKQNPALKTITSEAPARLCLFGDHQDYLGLPVIACAISRAITIKARPNNSDYLLINLKDIKEERRIHIHDQLNNLQARDYFGSAIRVLRKYGCHPSIGYDITIEGTIPINAGVSSSSALNIAWIRFLIEAFEIDNNFTPEFLGALGYEAEVIEHNEPGGMMDQYSIALGNIVYLETVKPHNYLSLGTSLNGLVVGVSGIPKKTMGVLSLAKDNALEAIGIVKQHHPDFDIYRASISEISLYVACLPSRLIPYFEAAIKNHQYTKEALVEFNKPILNMEVVGRLMTLHHQVLRDLLIVSVPKIDAMIQAALEAGAYGAKIVGSGGGGCIVALAKPGFEQKVVDAIFKAGAQDAFQVEVSKGARIV